MFKPCTKPLSRGFAATQLHQSPAAAAGVTIASRFHDSVALRRDQLSWSPRIIQISGWQASTAPCYVPSCIPTHFLGVRFQYVKIWLIHSLLINMPISYQYGYFLSYGFNWYPNLWRLSWWFHPGIIPTAHPSINSNTTQWAWLKT